MLCHALWQGKRVLREQERSAVKVGFQVPPPLTAILQSPHSYPVSLQDCGLRAMEEHPEDREKPSRHVL